MNNHDNNQNQISLITLGLAIFSMLFGAGNIIYPIKAGVVSGSQNFWGILGFLLTGVLLPVIGLVAMILFDGDYKAFFNRLGKTSGFIAILFCMFIIGPMIAMPRCITVPYEMILPFLPEYITLPIFSTLFTLITFLLTYKESKLLEVLGNIISPALVASLTYVTIAGLWNAHTMVPQTMSTSSIFIKQIVYGFQTLDLLATLFFAYIILKILKDNDIHQTKSPKQLALMSLQGGLIGACLLMLIYIGFSYLGAFYGNLINDSMNEAAIFRTIALHVINTYGALVIIVAALMACFSTVAALATVFAEYIRNELCNKKIGFIPCLIITLVITTVIANFGLTNILIYSAPFINTGYPIIISIVACNLAYKLFDFEWIKLPVALTTVGMIAVQVYPYVVSCL